MKKNKNYCDLEQTIMDSKRGGSLTEEQQKHIGNCSICSDSLTVFNWLNKFDKISSKEADSGHVLPRPEDLWKKAVKPDSNKNALIKKAMRPIAIAQFSTYFVILIGIIFVLLGKFSILNNFMNSIAEKSNLIKSITSLFDALSKTLPFLIVPLGMVAFLLISYFIYSLFNPENA